MGAQLNCPHGVFLRGLAQELANNRRAGDAERLCEISNILDRFDSPPMDSDPQGVLNDHHAAIVGQQTSIEGLVQIGSEHSRIIGVMIDTIERLHEKVIALEASLIGAGIPLRERKKPSH